MKKNHTTKLMTALLMVAVSPTVWGQQPVKQQKPIGELASSQIEAVRKIGQAVLGAKHSYKPPAALSASRAELEALKTTIDKAQSVVPNATVEISSATSPAIAGRNQVTQRAKEKQDMDLHLQTMRARHAELDAHMAKNKDGAERELEHGASAKILELETELANAQALPDAERWERLGALREKLTPKSSSPAPANAEPTPTISTIAEHRR